MKLSDIPKLLRTWRLREGVSQADAAKDAYMSQAALSRLETGKDGVQHLDNLQRIAEALNINVHIEFSNDVNPLSVLRRERDEARGQRDAALQLMRVYLNGEHRLPEVEKCVLDLLVGIMTKHFPEPEYRDDEESYFGVSVRDPDTGQTRELYRIYVFAVESNK
ncbi:MAG: helix-turn-helix domain-containing protein [Aggregatilineales bacterium]